MTAESTPRPEIDSEHAAADEDGVEPDSEPEPLPLDLTFEILKNQRRRLVLSHLRTVDGESTIGDLAEHIAAIENDCDVQALGAQQRKRVYIGLYQCHLPKMDDAGVISFNQSRGNVEIEPEAEPLYQYLVDDDAEADPEDGSVDPRRYGAATFGIGALFGVTQFMGYHLLASVLVFAFLGAVLYLSRRELTAE
ncbi:hypothetical protein GRX01_03270 [Halobaculum sp. WSA2]|uniref:DUF7344 domain-containing protein n=1 Tax=Halobaculum saliterrae TaxID=2073113 RepID=A0A6B0SPN4_9EURY|nr:hypothetical protein [Halobaculum saliterrae]MXR40377.1 hypothetical protein [Halobaculum saliterrae]